MQICGLRKVTLLDYPGLVGCTIFTLGCQFCCPFCQNSSLVTELEKSEIIPTQDVLDFLKMRVGKLDGVCITGGEPLIQSDLKQFISLVKSMGYKVKLDSNGYLPIKLKELVEAKLIDCVAMDIKNSYEKYPFTTGVKNLDIEPIKESIAYLLSNKVDYEFRTTAVKEFHTAEDFKKIAVMIKGAKAYYIQNFVDSGAIIQQGLHGFDKDTLEGFKKIMLANEIPCQLRGVD